MASNFNVALVHSVLDRTGLAFDSFDRVERLVAVLERAHAVVVGAGRAAGVVLVHRR